MNVLGFAGFSGSGKTTLIERLVPVLVGHGWRVSLLKHAHHAFDVDRPGKDSWRHRQAGCTEVLVGSANRWALMHELRGEAEPTLNSHKRCSVSVCGGIVPRRQLPVPRRRCRKLGWPEHTGNQRL